MQKTLKEIADLVCGEIIGDQNVVITGVAGIKEAGPGDITFLANPKYIPLIDKTNASAIITTRQIKSIKPIIRTDNPSLAFTQVINSFSTLKIRHPQGIHPSVILGRNISLGKNVAIGPYTVIEDDVSIGDNSIIYSGCFIGHSSKIAADALIYPNVSIREATIIGKRVIIHVGAVIGSDGFGFITIDGEHKKIPQVGIVEMGDDVEIGANVIIDRARFDKTVIGSGTKIDNLTQIAHNVSIGENSMIIAQVGIAGSTIIGKNVTIAGQAGVGGHINIGDGAIVAGKAGVTKSVPAGAVVSGYPAHSHDKAKQVHACVQNLPRLYEQVRELKKKIADLEKISKK